MASLIRDAVSHATGSASSTEKANTDASGHDKTKDFRLRITAGPTYDKSLQRVVLVNSPDPHPVSDAVAVSLRIREYDGLPSSSPSSVPEYFDLPQHSKDTFSVAFSFTPPRDMPASDLYFGIDTGHNPIRKFGIPKSLVNTAFKIVKEFIDPSLACDAGADEPWVRGPVVAGATTTLCVGERRDGTIASPPLAPTDEQPNAPPSPPQTSSARLSPNPSASASPRPRSPSPSVLSSPSSRKSSASSEPDLSHAVFPSPSLLVEGATSPEAQAHRRAVGLPSDAGKRRKHLNSERHLKKLVLQKGRTYYFDFSNGYIDWKNYALKLPGFSVPVLKYLGGGKPPSSSLSSASNEGGDQIEGTEGGADGAVPGRDGAHDLPVRSASGAQDAYATNADGRQHEIPTDSPASRPSTAGGDQPSATENTGKAGSHKVRFFLKDIRTDEVFFVIMCTLLTGSDLTAALEEDGRAAS
ncbi:Dynactin, isoform [Sphaceloma murrayae]|uniref:Dynactin, isoform n=1 Tax=Sphaceloma murrayae TaxID=2082308 RepID=A0A2K1QMG1_9PEZI|nr:Dynactin, isoform [Sphaceloma murrayae]